MRVVALIDGEHYPEVVRDALDRLGGEHDLCGVLFMGGQEKVGPLVLDDPARHYGRDVAMSPDDPAGSLRELAASAGPEAVVDLSGEPVLDGRARSGLASLALHLGLEYRSPGLHLAPPRAERPPFEGPVLAVIGTGKRTGKTAVTGHYASLLAGRGREPVVVAMGRGGPAQPQLVRADEAPSLAGLLEIVRAGGHAASDYLEDAVLAGVSCVGCRRCGDGPAGETFDSNVGEGATMALSLNPGVLLFEGSGAAIPPVDADRTVCVTSATRARREGLLDLGPYRLLRSDLVVVTGAGSVPPEELEALKAALGQWCEPATLIGCDLHPEPVEHVSPESRVAFFTTAPGELESELRGRLAELGIDVRVFSSSLAVRGLLEADLERATRERCDTYLTELKAAAVEVVARHAETHGARVVFVRNRPASLPGEPDLDEELARLSEEARAKAEERQPAAAGGER